MNIVVFVCVSPLLFGESVARSRTWEMDSIFPFTIIVLLCVCYRDVGVCFTTDFTDTSPYLLLLPSYLLLVVDPLLPRGGVRGGAGVYGWCVGVCFIACIRVSSFPGRPRRPARPTSLLTFY